MPLVYRPASEQDLGRAQELVVRSINDLTERHGFGPMAVLRPTQFQSFSLKDDPDGLWVAEDTGELLGFAFSWVCEERLTADIIELARQYGRYGYRKIAELLRRAGWTINDKRVERIWQREGLKVPHQQPKRGRLWHRQPQGRA
jgi:hypothetical protein